MFAYFDMELLTDLQHKLLYLLLSLFCFFNWSDLDYSNIIRIIFSVQIDVDIATHIHVKEDGPKRRCD